MEKHYAVGPLKVRCGWGGAGLAVRSEGRYGFLSGVLRRGFVRGREITHAGRDTDGGGGAGCGGRGERRHMRTPLFRDFIFAVA